MIDEFLFARARAINIDRRKNAPFDQTAVEMKFTITVPLNSSKMISSIRLPVSISALATIVRLPPPSILRAEPKNRFGFWSAFDSKPPDIVLP